MKKNITTAIVVFISLLPLGYLAISWNSIPQIVPVHYGIDLKPDRMGDKSELGIMAGILGAISILIYFLFKNLHRIDPKRKEVLKSPAFLKLALGIVVFMAVLSILIISSAKGNSTNLNLLFPLLGLLFAFLGNYMYNIKPNYFAGFRVPWTLNDDDNWRKTHHLGSKIWFAGGMLIAIVSLFLPAATSFIFFLSIVFIMVLIPLIYSYRLFKNKTAR